MLVVDDDIHIYTTDDEKIQKIYEEFQESYEREFIKIMSKRRTMSKNHLAFV
jgi:hypothetical protein